MPADLEQQLARFAEALDRGAPTISFDEMVGRGTVAGDVDRLELPSSDRASGIDNVSWIDTTPRHETGGGDVLIELDPALVGRGPAWRPIALKVALVAAAIAVFVVTLATIERGSGELDPVDDFPRLTTTFVSPRNGFSIRHPGGAAVTPADELWEFGGQVDQGFDVVETHSAGVFKGASKGFPGEGPCLNNRYEPIPCGSIDEQVDRHLSTEDTPGGCGVPRGRQADITIDGDSGRIAECPNHVEATVIVGGRLYLFTLTHDRDDARAVFDVFVATIDLTPKTAVDFPAMTTTFVSPTYGYSFKFHDRGGLAPVTEPWDPDDEQLDDIQLDDRFDAVGTGMGAYFVSASAAIPDAVSIDEWYDENVSPSGCGVPRSQQPEITIDGQSGTIAECPELIEATVVAGGRLYLFMLGHQRSDARAWFDAWVATIDLTPQTATP